MGEYPIYIILLAYIQKYMGWFLLKLGVTIETIELYFLIPVWMTLYFIQFGLKSFFYHLSCVGSLKLKLHLFCTVNIQGKKLYGSDLTKYTFNIGLHLAGRLAPICFKLGIMLDTTKFCGMMPVWVIPYDWTLPNEDQGHRVMWNIEPVQLFCHKVVWSNRDHDSLCKGHGLKKKSWNSGKCGLFEHLLFLLIQNC